MNRVRRLLQLPGRQRRLLARAALELLRSAWRVRRWTFARVAATLGPAAAVSEADAAAAGSERGLPPAVRDVQWAIGAWTRAWPWPPTCLMQALAARTLLVEQGLPCDLYFGVRGSTETVSGGVAIGAHAWLRCGAHVVTGASEARQHRPIAVYRAQGATGGNTA